MKKGLLIFIGAFILISLIAIWAYLFFFGTPKSTDDVFANLGIGDTIERSELEDSTPEPVAQIETPVPKKPLRQLTVRPAAGFFVPDIYEPTSIRYVERGTGHIFEVEIATGNEMPITKFTVPQVVEAVFSPKGTSVIFTTYVDNVRNSFVGVLGNASGTTELVNNIPLPPKADNVSYLDEQTILYTITTPAGTAGYRYHLDSQTQIQLFTIPLNSITMLWGNGLDSIYLYTKPTRLLEGFAYRVENNTLYRVGTGARGLMYFRNNTTEMRTTADLHDIYSEFTFGTSTVRTPVPFLPEKCAFIDSEAQIFWCGSSMEKLDPTFVEAWYKGELSSPDGLWRIDAATGNMAMVSDLGLESGREIDIQSIATSKLGHLVFFTNKLDGTIWLFDALLAAGIDVRN